MNHIDIKFYMKFTARPIWNIVTDIRKQIKFLMEKKNFSIDTVDSLEITAMELFENAIKYGISTEDAVDVSLEISYDDKQELQIIVSNGIESEESITNFLELIDKIRNSNNVESLYLSRLQEIARNPKTNKSQLGLFRIAYEAEFIINYEIIGKKLIIKATKKVEDNNEII